MGIQMFFILLMLVLFVAGVEVVPFVLDRVPLDIKDDVDFLRGLAWDERDVDTDVIERLKFTERLTERTTTLDTLGNFFYIKDGNVLTKENFRYMQKVQEKMFNFPKFQESYCKLDQLEDCEKPKSLLQYFDGSMVHIDPIFNDPNFDNIISVLHKANSLNATKRNFQNFMGKTSVISSTEARSEITKLTIAIGYPLKGYETTTDREVEQEDDVKEFCLNDWNPLAEEYYKDGLGEMEYYYSSIFMLSAVIERQVLYDQMLAVGSLTFIVLFMILQTGSLWVTCFSIVAVASSFITSALIYRFIFNYQYFGVFHVLAVFIVLGIGADNTFVFFDTWKETGFKHYKSLAHRMSDTYRKAAMAMFFTTFTTAAAFIVSAISPFLAISAFGVFSGILIMVNYIGVITILPTVVLTYHCWWAKYKCCCCCPRASVDDEEKGNVPMATQPGKQRTIVRFFTGPFYLSITHRVGRWCILGVLVVFIIFCAAYSSKIAVQEDQVRTPITYSRIHWIGNYNIFCQSSFK